MTSPTCYTPCLVSLSDKSDDDRLLENLPNVLLLTHLLYRLDGRTREIHTVLATCAAVDEVAKTLIAVTRIHENDVCPLFPVLAAHVVGEEGFSATARPQNEFVTVGNDTLLHR